MEGRCPVWLISASASKSIIAGMDPVADNPVIAPDREPEQETAARPFRSTHPLPALRLVTPRGRPLVLLLRARMEHIRYGYLPCLPPPVDFNPVPQVWRWSPHSEWCTSCARCFAANWKSTSKVCGRSIVSASFGAFLPPKALDPANKNSTKTRSTARQ